MSLLEVAETPLLVAHIAPHLTARCLAALEQTCRRLRALVADPGNDRVLWRECVARTFSAPLGLLSLKEGRWWREAMHAMYQELLRREELQEVLAQQGLYAAPAWLLLQNDDASESDGLFEDAHKEAAADKLGGAYENWLCGDSPLEDFFEEAGLEAYVIANDGVVFPLAGGWTLRVVFGQEGYYFSLESGEGVGARSVDLGRIDGHQVMPALRWEEVVAVHSYATAPARRAALPCTPAQALLILSMLAFPSEEEKDAMGATVARSFVEAGILDGQNAATYARRLTVLPAPWVEEDGVWLSLGRHTVRHRGNMETARLVSEVLAATAAAAAE